MVTAQANTTGYWYCSSRRRPFLLVKVEVTALAVAATAELPVAHAADTDELSCD